MNDHLPPALELRHVSRIYRQGEKRLDIFDNLGLTLPVGEIAALVGPSGSGKSSLLHIAGLLEKPTSGEVWIAGRECTSLDDLARTRVRRLGIGFVYQFHHLLPEFSAEENVILPQLIAGESRKAATARARELLDQLGLSARLKHRPAELSGGEQQRVAIARALANNPSIILADEPTGNLDLKTGQEIINMLKSLSTDRGVTVITATHDHKMLSISDRIMWIQDGRMERLERREDITIKVGRVGGEEIV